LGRDDFENIAGEHVNNNTDVEVLRVNAFLQNTTIIPRILCRQFGNLEEIFISSSGIESLTRNSFANCWNLKYLVLENNNIQTISNGIFSNLERLDFLNLARNRINLIESNAFVGTSLSTVFLDNNRLLFYNPSWFEPVNNTMIYLSMANNVLHLPNGAFNNLKNLLQLTLSGNEMIGISIPIDAFAGLDNLRYLYLDGCDFREIRRELMEPLQSLERLYLQNNRISRLPDGVVPGKMKICLFFVQFLK
jgi:Leucine-rich repeat (LRR) protein